jgi:hypothetical protein
VGLRHFNTFVEGHKYTAVTDHAALKYLYNAKDKTARMHRLVLRLQPYDLTLHYGPGSQNHAADLLSREDTYMQMRKSEHLNTVSTQKRPRNTAGKIEYEIDRIVSRRPIPGRADEYEYQVKWTGYGDVDNTWEPIANLGNAAQSIADFETSLDNRNQNKIQKDLVENVADLKLRENGENKEKSSMSESKSKQEEKMKDTLSSDFSDNYKMSVCDICNIKCNNYTDLLVHKYHDHDVPIPAVKYDVQDTPLDLLKSLQQHEPQFRVIYDSKFGENELSHMTIDEEKMMRNHTFVLDEDDVLCCVDVVSMKVRSRVRTQLRTCIPKTLRQQVMKQVHEGVLSGHPGIVHMYDKLRENVWWPNMLKDVVMYVKNCDLCQQVKNTKMKVPHQSVTVPTGPRTHISVDYVGPLPTTHENNKYILVVECQYLRYVEAFAVDEMNTQKTADIIIRSIICRYGLPLVMVSDRGAPFVSQLAGTIYKKLGIKQSKTSAHHPQANGIVERFNKTMKMTLKLWCNEAQTDWDTYLPFVVFAYNTSYHSLVQETPFYLQFGVMLAYSRYDCW